MRMATVNRSASRGETGLSPVDPGVDPGPAARCTGQPRCDVVGRGVGSAMTRVPLPSRGRTRRLLGRVGRLRSRRLGSSRRRARRRPHACSRCSTHSPARRAHRLRRRGGALVRRRAAESASSPLATRIDRTTRPPRFGTCCTAAPIWRWRRSRAWDEFGVLSLRALQRAAADRQLCAPGARSAERPCRPDRSTSWGGWTSRASGSCPAPCAVRSASGTASLPRTTS